MAPPSTVGMVIDGSLGRLLANNLSQRSFHVQVCEIMEVSENDHQQNSDLFKCSSPKEAAQGAATVCFIVSDIERLEAAFLSALSGVAEGTVIILCGAFLPTYLMKLERKLSGEQKGLLVVDLYASLGTNSEVKILASGNHGSLEKTRPVLSAMCEDFVEVEGDLGAASKVQMVDKLLVGVHIAAAAEAMALGASAGLNTWDLYEIIINAAGSSRAFEVRVPQMLADDRLELEKNTIDDLAKTMNAILEEARGLLFPLPLTSIAHQYFLMGSSCGYGDLSDAAVVKVWERMNQVKLADSVKNQQGSFASKAEGIFKGAAQVERVGFIGLGAMGFGMATTLVQEKFTVSGFDVYEPTLSRFEKAGGLIGNSVAETSKGAQVVIVMVATETQAESVLFGEQGAVRAVSDGCTFILCSTVSPLYVESLEQRLQAEKRDLQLVDAPVSGGVKKAANGTLTIMAAGSAEAFKRAGLVLSALSETLYVIDGGAGKGSAVKVVNQLLAGVHIAAAGEAMALGARLGLNTRNLYQNIISRDGSSWMFVNRVPHMLDADYTPYSAVNIFVKDLGIVLSQGKSCGVHLHLAATAHQQFLLAAAAGFAFQDDSAVVKVIFRKPPKSTP